jgi:Ca2+-binding RTX toxin-like protein
MSGYQTVTLADGSTAAVDGSGRIQAVFNNTQADGLVALGYAAHMSEEFPNPLDPAVTASLLGGQTPAAFTETNTSTYNGDVNPQIGNTNFSSQVYGVRTAGTSQSDLIFAQAGADGGSSDDVIVGGTADQTLNGGGGNDIIWGRGGVDNIDGGSEDDILRGGAGDDSLRGGSGNDLIDGGDININKSDDGVDTALFDDGSGGQISLASQGAGSSGPQFLLMTRGTEVDTLHSIEKITLSDGADTLKIAAPTMPEQMIGWFFDWRSPRESAAIPI